MNLKQFLRFVCDTQTENGKYYNVDYSAMNVESFSKSYFKVPYIHCKDGFGLSIQINNGNYCESENGYRQYGKDWLRAEWGFTSIHEPLLSEDAEGEDSTTNTVGMSNVELLQQVIDKHGGFDWDKIIETDKP